MPIENPDPSCQSLRRGIIAVGVVSHLLPPWKNTNTGCLVEFLCKGGVQMFKVRQSSLCGVPRPPAKALMTSWARGVKPGKSTGLDAVCGQSLVMHGQYKTHSKSEALNILALPIVVNSCSRYRMLDVNIPILQQRTTRYYQVAAVARSGVVRQAASRKVCLEIRLCCVRSAQDVLLSCHRWSRHHSRRELKPPQGRWRKVQ